MRGPPCSLDHGDRARATADRPVPLGPILGRRGTSTPFGILLVSLASGQTVRHLTLDQGIEGSNPSSPATPSRVQWPSDAAGGLGREPKHELLAGREAVGHLPCGGTQYSRLDRHLRLEVEVETPGIGTHHQPTAVHNYLVHRLDQPRVLLPPLRERRVAIVTLFDHQVDDRQASRAVGVVAATVRPAADGADEPARGVELECDDKALGQGHGPARLIDDLGEHPRAHEGRRGRAVGGHRASIRAVVRLGEGRPGEEHEAEGDCARDDDSSFDTHPDWVARPTSSVTTP